MARRACRRSVNTPEIRFDCPDERKFAAIEEVEAEPRAPPAPTSTAIDGVRVNTPDGWWLLRASNTQAVIVARAEAADADGLERLKVAGARRAAPRRGGAAGRVLTVPAVHRH